MATNCELIEEQLNSQKCPISNSASISSMTHEEKQDSTEKSQSKSSFSDMSSEMGSGGSLRQNGSPLPPLFMPTMMGDDVFENAFEASMDDLEHNGNNDGYESDSEPSLSGDVDLDMPKELHPTNSDDLTCSTGLGTGTLHTFPRAKSFEYHSSGSDSDSEDDDDDEAAIEAEIHAALSMSPKYYTHDIFQMRPYLMPFTERRRLSQCKEEDEDDGEKSPQPQNSEQAPRFDRNARPTPPPPPPVKDQASAEKFKDLERLRQQFMHKIDSINTNNVDDIKTVTVAPEHTSPPPPPPIPPTILPPALINLLESAKSTSSSIKPQVTIPTSSTLTKPHVKIQPPTPESPAVKEPPSPSALIIKGKFTVTKTQETPELPQLRSEVAKLKHLNSTSNAQTISFPSSFGGYSSVQGLFSQRYGSNKGPAAQPHLSKEFFDSSIVEIRSPAESTSSLNSVGLKTNCDTSIGTKSATASATTHSKPAPPISPQSPKYREFPHLDDVWIKRPAAGTTAGGNRTPQFPLRSAGGSLGSETSLPRKQYYYTDESAAESGRTTAVQSEDVSFYIHIFISVGLNLVKVLY